ncbi:MAG: hypothetical protein ACRDYF_12440, partial [Acidimicrobiia bacterium]
NGTVLTSGWDGERFVMAAFPKKGKPTRRPIPCATDEGFDVGLYGSVVAAPDGTLFWAMSHQDRVVRINPDGSGGCYAGTGQPGFSGDGGPAIDAMLKSVTSLAYDPDRRELYVADSLNLRVRRIDSAGVISTFVGPEGMSGGESLNPMDIAFDARRGRLYAKEGPGIVYRDRNGDVKVIPNSTGRGFASEGLATDPTGGDLVTTRIVPQCDVARISDGGVVKVVGGLLRDPHCAYQSTVDADGDIWVVTDYELIVIRPGR